MKNLVRTLLIGLIAGRIVTVNAEQKSVLAAASTDRPNILFILVDDLGWTDVGYNGAKYHETPNIDKLAAQSLVFDRAYARPTCSPSRACLFTGLNAAHTGIYHVAAFCSTPKKFYKLDPPVSGHYYTKAITMLADALKQAGYSTGYVGKWHVTDDPVKNGFDFNAGGWRAGGPKSYFSPYKNSQLKDGPKGEYLPDRMADESIAFIKRQEKKPFFLCYAPYSVHYPHQAREEDTKKFKEKAEEDDRQLPVYAAMVYAADRAIGRVIDSLETLGIANNTIVIFTSDNGTNGRSGITVPLRGSKGAVYEGGTRVPTFVRWPGQTTARHTSALIDIIDWYPTLVEIASAQSPKHTLDGISQVSLLKGNVEKVRSTLFMHVPVYNGSDSDKNITPLFQTPATVGYSGKYKYIRNYEPDRPDELYDLEADVGETTDLSKTHPEVLAEMAKAMDQWIKENHAELPKPLN